MSTRDRRPGAALWIAAVLLTLAAAAYQRIVGPTRPVRGEVTAAGQEIRYRFARSFAGSQDYGVSLKAPDAGLQGFLVHRRFKTDDPWTWQALRREGDLLAGSLPLQPPAGKLIFQVFLSEDNRPVDLTTLRTEGQGVPAPPAGALAVPPSGPVVLRFRGAVPDWVLVPHVALMFLGMLLANRAGLEALRRRGAPRRFAWLALGGLVGGGLVLGPAVQWYSFGEAWTGVPFGWDLTDNKTLVAVLAWAGALFLTRKGKGARGWIVAAALVTLIVFSIPHSVLGTELDQTGVPASAPSTSRVLRMR